MLTHTVCKWSHEDLNPCSGPPAPMFPDISSLETQLEGHTHASCLKAHRGSTHCVSGPMLGTAELQEKLLPCWQPTAPRTLGSFRCRSDSTHCTRRPWPGPPVTPWEPCVALRKGQAGPDTPPGIAQGSSQQQSIPKEPREIPNFSAPTPSLFLTKASSEKRST